jgi:hypothetical protein
MKVTQKKCCPSFFLEKRVFGVIYKSMRIKIVVVNKVCKCMYTGFELFSVILTQKEFGAEGLNCPRARLRVSAITYSGCS